MLSRVLGVKKSINGNIMSIQFHLSNHSEQEAKMAPYFSLNNRFFRKNKMILEYNPYQ